MIPNPWIIVGFLVALIAASLGGGRVGAMLERGKWEAKELTRAEKLIVRQEVLIREVPKIVVKTVTKEVTVEKEVERVVTVVDKIIAPDCVLPDGFGMLLVAAARGLDPEAPGVADETRGTYGCRETLDATLSDLKAGWRNTARLDGLQEWARVVTSTSKGDSP